MTFDVAANLEAATAQREAIPGMPMEGPYPASIDEVADEVAEWVRRFAVDFNAPGFPDLVIERLIGRVGVAEVFQKPWARVPFLLDEQGCNVLGVNSEWVEDRGALTAGAAVTLLDEESRQGVDAAYVREDASRGILYFAPDWSTLRPVLP